MESHCGWWKKWRCLYLQRVKSCNGHTASPSRFFLFIEFLIIVECDDFESVRISENRFLFIQIDIVYDLLSTKRRFSETIVLFKDDFCSLVEGDERTVLFHHLRILQGSNRTNPRTDCVQCSWFRVLVWSDLKPEKQNTNTDTNTNQTNR